MFIIGDMIINFTGTGFVQGRVGNGTGSASPRGVYQAADGKWLSIAASNQGIAIRLFHAMGRPDILEDPRFATNAARMEHNDAIQAIVSEWVAARPRHEVLALLEEHEVVCSQVNDASDIVVDPHFSERTLVELTGSEALGRVLTPGPILHMGGYDGPVYAGVPTIGEHTDEVLLAAGLGADELARLRSDGVIGS